MVTLTATLLTTLARAITLPSNSNDFQFPHFIVVVDIDHPDQAYGTSFNAIVSTKVSSIFDFDVPLSYTGRQCELVFFFPNAEDLAEDEYTFVPKGGLQLSRLENPATTDTTWRSQPGPDEIVDVIDDLEPGNTYSLGSEKCVAGQRVGYKMTALGALELDYFQTYRTPSSGSSIPPIGLFIIAH